jgi:4,5-dihydroxyphthalate decarboxylase
LIGGTVKPQSFAIDFIEVEPIHRAFKPMAERQAYTISEMAVFTYLQAYAYDKPLVLLPIVLAARFQHGCLVYHRDYHDKLTTADLAGKKVGVRSYTQTTGAWVRNILATEYGVDLKGVKWITYEGAHLAEYKEPPFVQRAPAGAKLIDQFMAGEVDAAILGNDLPDDPKIVPVIPNAAQAGPAAFAKTGLVPINHMLVVTKDLAASRPDIVRDIYATFQKSKAAADLAPTAAALRPFGFSEIAPSLEVVIQLAYDQQIIDRRFTVDELFADAKRILGDNA